MTGLENNYLLERRRVRLREMGQLILGFCIVVGMTWVVAEQYRGSSALAEDAIKVIEINEIAKAIALFEITAGAFPELGGSERWCEIGRRYGDRICLYELERDGYFAALPVSPDESPYLYSSSGRSAFLATQRLGSFEEDETCFYYDDEIWCIEIVRL